MVPMACAMLVTVVAISILNAWLAGRRVLEGIQSQVHDMAETLVTASFPLTDSVLRQMRGLSGAEFVVADRSGALIASSREGWPSLPLPAEPESAERSAFLSGERVTVDGESFFSASLRLKPPQPAREGATLYVLYPVARYYQAWREAVLPPLGAGLAGLVTMVFLSFAIASRVTRPIHRLCEQVERIGHGEFVPVATSSRDDEVRDLGRAVNRLAEVLSEYEAEVRRSERLRTLGRMGARIAHQLRNAATGCRLAVDLHARSCAARDQETLRMVRQQLDWMEDFLERFLSLGKWKSRPLIPLDLTEIVRGVLPLVQPKAEHLGVALEWTPPSQTPPVAGNADGLAQLLVNLIVNAIEAAAERREPAQDEDRERRVSIHINSDATEERVRIHVVDTGTGPPESVRETLFDSLVSGKPEGIGLGLAIAREVVQHHHGSIRWRRRDSQTHFTVELPTLKTEPDHEEIADRR